MRDGRGWPDSDLRIRHHEGESMLLLFAIGIEDRSISPALDLGCYSVVITIGSLGTEAYPGSRDMGGSVRVSAGGRITCGVRSESTMNRSG